MQSHEFLSQTLCHNELILFNDSGLEYRNWIESGIVHVFDLFDISGVFVSSDNICNVLIEIKGNWICQYQAVRKTIISVIHGNKLNVVMAKYINIQNQLPTTIRVYNENINILDKISKFFYDILIRKAYKKPLNENVWATIL